MAQHEPAIQGCIDTCLHCYRACLSMLAGHCLEAGGAHTEPPQVRLMLACAEICRTCAHVMLLGTDQHRHTCRACAEICERCSQDCERIGGMDECVAACRACAEQCRRMAA